jgi:phytoene desaturase
MSKIGVIGSGFAGLSAASYLASSGNDVHLFEKNEHVGGRARQFVAEGFTFDMGPSWYWMPEVFEKFFEHFGYKVGDFYELKKLEPSFRVYFGKKDFFNVPSNFEDLVELFENTEAGSGDALIRFMKEAEYKYKTAMDGLIYKPGNSITELMEPKVISGVFKLQVFQSFSMHVRKYFKDSRLIALMEFPVLFLGAMPKDTPALYSLMNYAGLKLGTWYPMGGFVKVIDGMKKVAENLGVNIYTSEPVLGLETNNSQITKILSNNHSMDIDGVIASADYHHIEQTLLKEKHRNYSSKYWENRTMSPSSLIFYIGVNKKVENIEHHNLFFHTDFEQHAKEIYKDPKWPENPLFYVCCPSKIDPSVAPENSENLFFLIPIAPGIKDEESIREEYYLKTIAQFEELTGESIMENIVYKKSYCIKDFESDYNSYKGNAYGLANTIMQTANLKPKLKNKNLNNLFYAGQLTVPGPGVPPGIISGEISAKQLLKSI